MSISTYAELVSAMTNWTHRGGLSDRIPEFIVLGEARIGREVKAKQMEQRTSLTPTTQYVSLPADFVSARAVRIEGSEIGWLDYMTPENFFANFSSSSQSSTKVYTIIGSELVFPKTPSGNIELWYFKRLAALSSAVNSLFTANPDLYLYASMAAAMPFLKKFADMPAWELLYEEVRDQINKADKEGRYGTGMFVKAVT